LAATSGKRIADGFLIINHTPYIQEGLMPFASSGEEKE